MTEGSNRQKIFKFFFAFFRKVGAVSIFKILIFVEISTDYEYTEVVKCGVKKQITHSVFAP